MILLELKDVRKSYGYDENKVNAINHIHLTIDEGSFVAIIGKSGSGKSTLLHVMGGLTKPQQGTVLLEGNSLYDMSDDQLSRYRRRRMGFVFQFYNLISSLNVLENIVLPIHLDHLKEDKEYIDELLVLGFKGKGDSICKGTFWWSTTKSCYSKSVSYEASNYFS